jgi:WS/DGAT/MGAT family acyltransferase
MNMPIAPLDLMWFLMETPASPTHVGAMLVFEKPRNRPGLVREIVELYRAHEPAPPFNFIPELTGVGVPRFRKAGSYDPRYHVQHLALPAGSTYDDALRLVADLHEPMLDRDRPLFRTWLIDGLPGGRFALYTKMHHAIVDGVSAARRIQASLSTTRGRGIPPPPFAVRLPSRKARRPQALVDKIATLGTVAREQTVALGDVSLGALRKRFRDLFASDPAGSLPFMAHPAPMNQPLHMARSYATLTLPFNPMRAVGKHFGATLNDVAVTIVDHAVHRYLRATGRAFPHRLIAMLPMSLRDEGDSDGGTKVSAMFAPLGEDGATVIERTHQIKASVASAKRELGSMSKDAAMMYAVAALGIAELAAVTHLDRLTRPLANLVISNVPGVREAGYLGGAPLVGTFPISAIAASVGLNVTFTSNHERMDFGFVGDGITMYDMPKLAEFTRRAFDTLSAVAG